MEKETETSACYRDFNTLFRKIVIGMHHMVVY